MASFTESAPASDDDPYSSSKTPSYHIDRSGFPKPVPIFGPLMGYDDKFFAKVTRLKIERGAAAMKRPLTSDEANAMAYWAAKQISILSYSVPIGVAGGAYRWWNTFDKYRFPFWGPNMETFNPREFPNKIPLLTGAKAPYAWHVMRALFYVGAGKFTADILFGSYAISVAAVGELADKRLKDVRDALQREVSGKTSARNRPGQHQAVKPASTTAQSETPYDDTSPSGGMYFDEVKEDEGSIAPTFGGVSEKSQPEAQQQYRRWPQSTQQPAERDESPFLPFNDDSPTGGQSIAVSTSSPLAPPSSSGSAWERIRSGQKSVNYERQVTTRQNTEIQQPGQSPWTKRQSDTQNGDSQDDGFTTMSSQEARRYSREEAQREFDAKLERERRGGDFASGGGDQKRW